VAYDIDNLQSFTAAEMLKAVEYAIVAVSIDGQTVSIGGRMYGAGDLDKLRKLRDVLKREVAEAGSVTGTLTALGVFGTQQ